MLTTVVETAPKGSRTIKVEDSSGMAAGDVILLSLRNTTDRGDLIYELMAPIQEFHELQKTARSAGKLRAASYQWLVEVEKVPDGKTLILKQPLRRDFNMRFLPEVHAAPMLLRIGIEDIQFISDWTGPYSHHGHGIKRCTLADKVEVDYGWKAICFTRVAHGWIRNVSIENYTVPVTLQDSRNVTVQDVVINDPENIGGHYGIKCYSHACDNLIEDVQINSYRTHGTGVEGNSYGNVFRNITFSQDSSHISEYDSHGFCDAPFSPPACNLFENIIGQGSISGGGAKHNLPHASQYNTFWNCKITSEDGEVFESFASEMFGVSAYQLFPKSILVGVSSDLGAVLTLDGKAFDRDDDWLYVEGLNGPAMKPASLYEAQLKLRLGNDD